VDQCVLTFHRRVAGVEGCVPSALDAFTHAYFWPAAPTARWGRTRDLASIGRRRVGVRECVVAPFAAGCVERYEVLEA
jgi:hypothetical protein